MNLKTPLERLLYASSSEESFTRRVLLFPLYLMSIAYGCILRVRQTLYRLGLFKSYTLPCPVVSVGNITLGGTGKTPTVIYLAHLFQEQRMEPVVLSRGYKAQGRKKIAVVADGTRTLLGVREAGDEPFLLSHVLPGVPIIIGPNRALSGRFACERFSPDVVLLDDGLQHLRLKRDVDIVLVDCTRGFGSGHLLPRGILREHLEALGRAHIFLLTKHLGTKDDHGLTDQMRLYNPQAPIFFTHYEVSAARALNGGEEISLSRLKGKKVLALAGIGNPHYFTSLVEQCGMSVTDEWTLPDHHHYTAQDAGRLGDYLSGVDYIVTTAKDSCKMDRACFHNLPILTLEVVLQIDEEEKFKDALFTLMG